MKETYIKYLLLLLLLVTFNGAYANDEFQYTHFIEKEPEELLELGKQCLLNEKLDSALTYFTLTCKKVEDYSDVSNTEIVCEAYYQKWYIYFSQIFDYSKALENLLEAVRLRNNSNLYYPKVDIAMAIFNHTLFVQSKNKNLEVEAVQYCRKAYESALSKKDRQMMNVSIGNMLIMEFNIKDFAVVDNIWDSYTDDNDTSLGYKFNLLYYEYVHMWEDKDNKGALQTAYEMLKIASEQEDWRRVSIAYISISEIYYNLGNYKKALEYTIKNEKLGCEKKLRDQGLEILSIKADIYLKLGNKSEADRYTRLYLLKKDSVLNYTQMSNINQAMFNVKINKMKEDIAVLNYKKEVHDKILLFVLIFSFLLVYISVMLYNKNVQLKRSNLKIYENSLQTLEYDNIKREQLKGELTKIESEHLMDNNEDIQNSETNVVSKEKYKTNKLSDIQKKKLLDKILNVMNNVDIICSESFSGKRLAELTGTSYNYVSIVINEVYGCDFNTFLNKFRVYEACRRFSDIENYGNYTIEAISESLGFKSRSTLNKSFKKIIGITPSEYKKIVRQKGSDIKNV